MKRSEAVIVAKKVLVAGIAEREMIDGILDLAQSAGGHWDPEEEPLAEKLTTWAMEPYSGGGYRLILATPPRRNITLAEATLAADLYNRRKDIETVASELRRFSSNPMTGGAYHWPFLRHWADLLEGKT